MAVTSRALRWCGLLFPSLTLAKRADDVLRAGELDCPALV